MSDYDDDRPDWREIDRKREKSRFYGRQEKKSEEGVPRDVPKDRYQSGRVKEALDRLFMGKKGTIEHDRAFKKVHQSYGSEVFLKNVTKYIEKFGLPDDAPTLLVMLDTGDQAVTLNVMEKISGIYGWFSQREKDDVLRKFSIMAMSGKSKEIRMRAEDLGGELG